MCVFVIFVSSSILFPIKFARITILAFDSQGVRRSQRPVACERIKSFPVRGEFRFSPRRNKNISASVQPPFISTDQKMRIARTRIIDRTRVSARVHERSLGRFPRSLIMPRRRGEREKRKRRLMG